MSRAQGSSRGSLGGRFGAGPHQHKRKSFDHGEPISRIDIRPVALFAMIVAVLALLWNLGQERTHTLLIDLPLGQYSSENLNPSNYILVRVNSDGQILVNGKTVPLSKIAESIEAEGMELPIVVFQPDADADYGTAALALGAIADAGVGRDSICLFGLEEHRRFEKTAVFADYLLPPAQGRADGWDNVSDYIPGGCHLLTMPKVI